MLENLAKGDLSTVESVSTYIVTPFTQAGLSQECIYTTILGRGFDSDPPLPRATT